MFEEGQGVEGIPHIITVPRRLVQPHQSKPIPPSSPFRSSSCTAIRLTPFRRPHMSWLPPRAGFSTWSMTGSCPWVASGGGGLGRSPGA